MTSETKAETPPTRETLPAVDGGGPDRWRFSRVSFTMTAANAALGALAFVTGPVLARALGPAGRGDLAAVLVPLHLTSLVAMAGLDVYATRAAARGRPVGTLALSLGALLVAAGLLVALVGIPISAMLAKDRAVVRTFLLIGFAVMVISLLVTLLVGIGTGLQRWRIVIAARLVPGVIVAAGVVILFVAGSLTVGSAAAVYIGVGLVAALIVAPLLWRQRFRFDRQVVKEAIPFGAKAWAGTTADLANTRLDQLLMITLVAPAELGLYAVAVSIGSSVATIVSSGISPPLLARISAGEVELAPRALRTVLFLLALCTVVIAAATPVLVSVLFGREFTDTTDPALVLLAAGLPLAGTEILTQTLNGVGRPGLPAVGQGVALLITVPGLLLLLPLMGIIGAALVSFVAYAVNFLILLFATMKICRMTAFQLLVPTRADLVWLWEYLRSRIGAGRSAPA